MATVVRAEISENNKYWISKHRHYELKHFCLQYPEWKKEYLTLGVPSASSAMLEVISSTSTPSDLTARYAIRRVYYAERIDLIEKIAKEADKYLYEYILRAVTEGLSYTYLKSKLKIPCGKDMYYDRYRRFFWLLSEARK
jgi:hypothetical protein